MFWNRNHDSGLIGLIAGQGQFPVLFAEAAASLGKKILVIGIRGITDPKVETFAEKTRYLDLGALEALISILKEENLKKVVLAGGVPKKKMYDPAFKMDSTASSFIRQNKNKGDDHLLKAFQLFLKLKCGVSVLDSRHFLKNALASKGVLTLRPPTAGEWEDLKFGYRAAKQIGKLDVGQTVVVKDGVVLAVEAIEGTDAAIQRAGMLGNGRGVIVKVCKPNQDLRFDLPCVGLETLESMKAASSSVLGVEAGKTIMLSRQKLIEAANALQMTIVGM
jgi:DUF1009 family protein